MKMPFNDFYRSNPMLHGMASGLAMTSFAVALAYIVPYIVAWLR